MMVTEDKYELPLVVADSLSELARLTGTDSHTIASAISHHNMGMINKTKWRRIEIEEDA